MAVSKLRGLPEGAHYNVLIHFGFIHTCVRGLFELKASQLRLCTRFTLE